MVPGGSRPRKYQSRMPVTTGTAASRSSRSGERRGDNVAGMPARQRFVVTGGAGFIGHHTVTALLAEGSEVLVVDDLRHACPLGAPGGADLVAADIAAAETAAAIARFRPA